MAASGTSATMSAAANWPLMSDNILPEDLAAVREFLSGDPAPILTQSKNVVAFEKEWSAWLGVKHSVFVNSGASANLLSMTALRWMRGEGEVIVPPLTWVSDVASVIQTGMKPVFVDIDPKTLGMNPKAIIAALTPQTKAVFLTYVLGYNALTDELLDELKRRDIPLIEDVCESHGATFKNKKLGSFGWLSNFSYYYAHHMSTIEGGMLCTDDDELYQRLRMLRSHGMTREMTSNAAKQEYHENHPDLNPDFIFAYPAFNVRSTEINAVLGRSQLKRLDANNVHRRRNLKLFLAGLDPQKYVTDFDQEGNCNYAFTLVIKEPNEKFRDNVMAELKRQKIEFRRGTSGGGNQLRQPYLKALKLEQPAPESLPHVDHVHFFGFYIGNYPTLTPERIQALCELLNSIPTG